MSRVSSLEDLCISNLSEKDKSEICRNREQFPIIAERFTKDIYNKFEDVLDCMDELYYNL